MKLNAEKEDYHRIKSSADAEEKYRGVTKDE